LQSDRVLRFITALCFLQLVAIAAIATVDHPLGVIGVLRDGISAYIAILGVFRVIRVVGILVILAEKSSARNGVAQFLELLKKWAGKINVPAIGHRVPFIAPPFVRLIYRQRLIRRIHGYDLLSRQITLPVIKFPLIAESEASLLAALWAELWHGDGILFASEDGGNLFVECEIIVPDLEVPAAIGARFLHRSISRLL